MGELEDSYTHDNKDKLSIGANKLTLKENKQIGEQTLYEKKNRKSNKQIKEQKIKTQNDYLIWEDEVWGKSKKYAKKKVCPWVTEWLGK